MHEKMAKIGERPLSYFCVQLLIPIDTLPMIDFIYLGDKSKINLPALVRCILDKKNSTFCTVSFFAQVM